MGVESVGQKSANCSERATLSYNAVLFGDSDLRGNGCWQDAHDFCNDDCLYHEVKGSFDERLVMHLLHMVSFSSLKIEAGTLHT